LGILFGFAAFDLVAIKAESSDRPVVDEIAAEAAAICVAADMAAIA
jgi:hypothetical protein